jgi:uncharacterized protein (TIGR00251 family)
LPVSAHGDHIRLSIRLTPNGGRDCLDGIGEDAAGDRFLKARVRAVPEDGKANKALVELLASRLGVAKSAVSVVAGHTARNKILRIDGDPKDLADRCSALTAPR